MRTIQRIVCSALLVFVCFEGAKAQVINWQPTNVVFGLGLFDIRDYATSLAVGDSNAVFAGTTGSEIFRWINTNKTWVKVGQFSGRQPIRPIVANGAVIFAGTNFEGIMRSVNYGWTWANGGLPRIRINAIGMNTTSVFAGSYNSSGDAGGVYRSNDMGITWTKTSLANRLVKTIGVNGTTIFVGTETNGVMRSQDNGTSWEGVSITSATLNVNAILVNGANIIVGTNGSGIFFSRDNGRTWGVGRGFESGSSSFVNELTSNGSTILTNTFGGLYRSTNNGETWTRAQGNNLCSCDLIVFNGTTLFGGYRGRSEVCRAENAITTGLNANALSSPFHIFPNPASELTTIEFDVPYPQPVRVNVVNSLGVEVAQLSNGEVLSGKQRMVWATQGVPSGVFMVQMIVGGAVSARSIVVAR
jgi:photosystem II stability/assembly factor-like uncharacterized protein